MRAGRIIAVVVGALLTLTGFGGVRRPASPYRETEVSVVRVLVSAASRHGSTAEIAERIGRVLRQEFADAPATRVDVLPPDGVDPDGYDALVLGSAVYMGHWLDGALRLSRRYAESGGHGPVWLFSSGPIGDPPKPDQQPVDVGAVVMATKARDHRLFTGVLDRQRLTFGERALVAALRAPYGDFRDWAAVESWARDIAAELRVAAGATATRVR
jgi:menaquinone-dependent protoporphyrinogen oxidase